jgi:hypothetical protein
MEQTDAAWAAGFIDGEGSIRIRILRGNRNTSYGLALTASQVQRAPLDKLQQLFGGAISLKHPSVRQGPNAAPYYTWMVTGHTAAMAISTLRPYLLVKGEQAVLGLEFQTHTGRGRGGRRLLTADELQVRQLYFDRMAYLNLRFVARRTAAETNPEGASTTSTPCDSPVCNDAKVAEGGRNVRPLKIVNA